MLTISASSHKTLSAAPIPQKNSLISRMANSRMVQATTLTGIGFLAYKVYESVHGGVGIETGALTNSSLAEITAPLSSLAVGIGTAVLMGQKTIDDRAAPFKYVLPKLNSEDEAFLQHVERLPKFAASNVRRLLSFEFEEMTPMVPESNDTLIEFIDSTANSTTIPSEFQLTAGSDQSEMMYAVFRNEDTSFDKLSFAQINGTTASVNPTTHGVFTIPGGSLTSLELANGNIMTSRPTWDFNNPSFDKDKDGFFWHMIFDRNGTSLREIPFVSLNEWWANVNMKLGIRGTIHANFQRSGSSTLLSLKSGDWVSASRLSGQGKNNERGELFDYTQIRLRMHSPSGDLLKDTYVEPVQQPKSVDISQLPQSGNFILVTEEGLIRVWLLNPDLEEAYSDFGSFLGRNPKIVGLSDGKLALAYIDPYGNLQRRLVTEEQVGPPTLILEGVSHIHEMLISPEKEEVVILFSKDGETGPQTYGALLSKNGTPMDGIFQIADDILSEQSSVSGKFLDNERLSVAFPRNGSITTNTYQISNRAPVFEDPSPIEVSAYIGESIEISPSVREPDRDAMIFLLNGAPEFLEVDEATGKITGSVLLTTIPQTYRFNLVSNDQRGGISSIPISLSLEIKPSVRILQIFSESEIPSGETITYDLHEYFSGSGISFQLFYGQSIPPSWITLKDETITVNPPSDFTGALGLTVQASTPGGSPISQELNIRILEAEEFRPEILRAITRLDAVATKFFEYQLPSDGFSVRGNVGYNVTASGGSWLALVRNKGDQRLYLQGTPSRRDTGGTKITLIASNQYGKSRPMEIPVDVAGMSNLEVALSIIGILGGITTVGGLALKAKAFYQHYKRKNDQQNTPTSKQTTTDSAEMATINIRDKLPSPPLESDTPPPSMDSMAELQEPHEDSPPGPESYTS